MFICDVDVPAGGCFTAPNIIRQQVLNTCTSFFSGCGEVGKVETFFIRDDGLRISEVEIKAHPRRAGVTVALNELHKRGIIETKRRAILVKDRAVLREVANAPGYLSTRSAYERVEAAEPNRVLPTRVWRTLLRAAINSWERRKSSSRIFQMGCRVRRPHLAPNELFCGHSFAPPEQQGRHFVSM